ncbi:major facilitator superfamily domain-containing protein [Microdochium trichocladiopsis]|uniref:Major facilitator superfamily domain-containing protein n=1 Tax=Microdochium trichocladiopsis TaxID=1682393 RepID=A0A9P9BM03_9PEZI|nr:major facilitator superfamily domain-containing protein [Microdochium trichocladiopsis]KAH7024955.1 major facilitator superfamily domain-containing protein [Microdochium trichocladiopsis]
MSDKPASPGHDLAIAPASGLDNNLEQEKCPDTEGAAVIGERDIKGVRWALAIFAILSSTFLFALDTTVVADIQPYIIQSVGEFQKFPWLGSAFVLPAATLQLPWAKAYSMFNVKWLYFANVTLFEIGSAISGAAPTMNALIVGRAIAGVGGCGMYIGGLTYLSVLTTPRERPFYVSLVTPVWGLGTVLGPLIGGAFAESHVGWRWGFYINLFLYAAVVPSMLFILPGLNFMPKLTTLQKLAKFDWLGLSIFVGWGISFVMAMQFGGTVYAWNSPSEIILWVFSGVLIVAMVLSHIYHPFIDAENRQYPAHLLKNLKLGALQYATFAGPAAVYIPIYYLPLYFQFARGETAVQAAVRLLPLVFMVVALSIISGALTTKVNYIFPWFFVGGILTVVGGALMSIVTLATSNPAIYGYTVILGLGGGCLLMSAFGCASAVIAETDVIDAIGVLSLAQGLGIVFFVSAAGIVFQNLGQQYIAPILPADFAGRPDGILAGNSSPDYQSFSPDVRALIGEAIVSAMGRVYILSIAAGALTVLASLLIIRTKVH